MFLKKLYLSIFCFVLQGIYCFNTNAFEFATQDQDRELIEVIRNLRPTAFWAAGPRWSLNVEGIEECIVAHENGQSYAVVPYIPGEDIDLIQEETVGWPYPVKRTMSLVRRISGSNIQQQRALLVDLTQKIRSMYGLAEDVYIEQRHRDNIYAELGHSLLYTVITAEDASVPEEEINKLMSSFPWFLKQEIVDIECQLLVIDELFEREMNKWINDTEGVDASYTTVTAETLEQLQKTILYYCKEKHASLSIPLKLFVIKNANLFEVDGKIKATGPEKRLALWLLEYLYGWQQLPKLMVNYIIDGNDYSDTKNYIALLKAYGMCKMARKTIQENMQEIPWYRWLQDNDLLVHSMLLPFEALMNYHSDANGRHHDHAKMMLHFMIDHYDEEDVASFCKNHMHCEFLRAGAWPQPIMEVLAHPRRQQVKGLLSDEEYLTAGVHYVRSYSTEDFEGTACLEYGKKMYVLAYELYKALECDDVIEQKNILSQLRQLVLVQNQQSIDTIKDRIGLGDIQEIDDIDSEQEGYIEDPHILEHMTPRLRDVHIPEQRIKQPSRAQRIKAALLKNQAAIAVGVGIATLIGMRAWTWFRR